MNLGATVATTAWLAASVPAHARFRRALQSPGVTQSRLLRGYLGRHAATVYGRAHGFADIRSYDDFVRCVPVVGYEEVEPWIDRIRRGESAVLTKDAVTRLLPTSGSTRARKLIPFTASLQRGFNAAIGPWMVDLCARNPSIALGPAYWSVTPPGTVPADETSTVPIGFGDDSEYLGGARARFVDAGMAVPSAVRHLADVDQFRYAVLLCLLHRADLRLISVWHPSFLALLLDALPKHWERLLSDLATGGCRGAGPLPTIARTALNFAPQPRTVARLRRADPTRPASLWPALRVVSCWADGHAGGPAAALQDRFPQVTIQPKGLLATEAFVTLPFAGAHPVAVCSHFFEFADAQGAIHPVEALRLGEAYEVIVTNGAGLWRYRLGDQVEVDGFVDETPSLRFLGRSGNISDRCGEKLSEAFVAQVIGAACAPLPRRPIFAMLAPDESFNRWHYTLYIESVAPDAIPDLARALDAGLSTNPHYALCRNLGQLGEAQIFPLRGNAYATYAAIETARGRRLGDLKPAALSRHTDWSKHFEAMIAFETTPSVGR